MLNNRFQISLLCGSLFAFALVADSASVEDRLAALESRIAELESRLLTAEQEIEVVEESSAKASEQSFISTLNPLVRNAWVNEAWTREDSWNNIKQGMSQDEITKLLGKPTRTIRSLKPRVDMVFFYEGVIGGYRIDGKVSFRDDKVIHFDKPTFE